MGFKHFGLVSIRSLGNIGNRQIDERDHDVASERELAVGPGRRRPGARRESLDNYLKRVKGLEDIANSFAGVSQSYAIQAGREIRIIVRPDDIDDLAAIQLSKDVARRVEDSLQYPGQIKVTVIRETRAVDYAK